MTNDQCDDLIVSINVPRFWLLKFLGGKQLVRAVVNRAYERGFIDSSALHFLHELNNRVFQTHEPHRR